MRITVFVIMIAVIMILTFAGIGAFITGNPNVGLVFLLMAGLMCMLAFAYALRRTSKDYPSTHVL